MNFRQMKKVQLAKYGFVYKIPYAEYALHDAKIVEIITWLVLNFGVSDNNNWFFKQNSGISIYTNSDQNAALFKLTWVSV